MAAGRIEPTEDAKLTNGQFCVIASEQFWMELRYIISYYARPFRGVGFSRERYRGDHCVLRMIGKVRQLFYDNKSRALPRRYKAVAGALSLDRVTGASMYYELDDRVGFQMSGDLSSDVEDMANTSDDGNVSASDDRVAGARLGQKLLNAAQAAGAANIGRDDVVCGGRFIANPEYAQSGDAYADKYIWETEADRRISEYRRAVADGQTVRILRSGRQIIR